MRRGERQLGDQMDAALKRNGKHCGQAERMQHLAAGGARGRFTGADCRAGGFTPSLIAKGKDKPVLSQRMPAPYKPDAGNQHARFDERGREPERGSSEHSHRTRPRLYRIWVPLGSCRTGVESELVTREVID